MALEFPECSEDSFRNTAEKIASSRDVGLFSDTIMASIFAEGNEIKRQKLIEALREKARELGFTSDDVESFLQDYRASQPKNTQITGLTVFPAMKQEGPNNPAWYINRDIDETKFCHELIQTMQIRFIGENFYDIDGLVPIGEIKSKINGMISPFISKNKAVRIRALVEALKVECPSTRPALDVEHIHLSNGTLDLKGNFTGDRYFCLNRLNVVYDPSAPRPQRWLKFISELLYPEDIPTLQEYLGYSLIPTTKAQKMLWIVGNGGEGKSRILAVAEEIFKESLAIGSLKAITTERFMLASLENKLIFGDDDIKEEALKDTEILKKLVTMEASFLIEKKGDQSYPTKLYSRLLLLGNFSIRSLYDHSEAFYRRLIILKTRPIGPGRINDPYLAEKLIEEKTGIFNWCFQGLQRLIQNNYQFTVSDRAAANLEEAKGEDCNVVRFLADENYVVTKRPDSKIGCVELYRCYEDWCHQNGEFPMRQNSITRFIK